MFMQNVKLPFFFNYRKKEEGRERYRQKEKGGRERQTQRDRKREGERSKAIPGCQLPGWLATFTF